MNVNLNDGLANALLDRFDTEFPAGSVLEIRTGAGAGANNPAGGDLLDAITAPASPWATAADGTKVMTGNWNATATAGGIAGHFRLRNAADTRRLEGAVSDLAGDGALKLSATAIHIGQPINLSGSTLSFA
jgi:hypothetical protein